MKKHYLLPAGTVRTGLFLLALLAATNLPAQSLEFAPVGAQWHYAFLAPWTGLAGDFYAECIKETVVNGQPCKQIKTKVNGDLFGNRFIFQSNDSIFQCNFGAPATFLFRNNYQIGDITRTSLSISEWKVVAIDTLLFNGIAVRRFTLQQTEVLNEKTFVYDRVGPELGFFGNWCGVPCDYSYYGICRYGDLAFTESNFSQGDCSEWVSVEEPGDQSLDLYPNPTYDAVQLSLPSVSTEEIRICVFDMTGKLVLHLEEMASSRETTVDVHNLSPGIYLMTVQTISGVYRQKFIKN